MGMAASKTSNLSVEPTNCQNVCKFRIILKHIKPRIWRRILVPENYNFRDLHLAINSSMGWTDCNMYQFIIKNPVTGKKEIIGRPRVRDQDGLLYYEMKDVDLDEKTAKISDYFVTRNYRAVYRYDYLGDVWDHEVVFQIKKPADASTKYPKCVGGQRACPPEKCGGPWGYQEMKQVLSDPMNPKYEIYRLRLAIRNGVESDKFDPDKFDPNEVHF